MALNIDIPATILAYAGIEQPDIYQGESLLSLLHGDENSSWREGFFCEHRMDHEKIPKYIGYHGQRFVYANYYEQEPAFEYLQDLQNNPDQLINLASHSEYQQKLQEMRGLCKSNEVILSGNQKINNYE